jgi:hypothetical protein
MEEDFFEMLIPLHQATRCQNYKAEPHISRSPFYGTQPILCEFGETRYR